MKNSAVTSDDNVKENVSPAIDEFTQWILSKAMSLASKDSLNEQAVSKILKKTQNTSEIISEVVKLDSWNTELAAFLLSINSDYSIYFGKKVLSEPQILFQLLLKDKDIYKTASYAKMIDSVLLKDFETHKILAQNVLKNFVKSSSSPQEIQAFIDKIANKNEDKKKVLQSMYESELKKASKVYKKWTKDSIHILFTQCREVYEILLNNKIIWESWDIQKGALKKYSELISAQIEKGELQSDTESLIQYLYKLLGISQGDQKIDEVKGFFVQFIPLLSIEEAIAVQDDKTTEETEENRDKERVSEVEWLEDSTAENLEYCGVSHVNYSWWSYSFNTWYTEINLSKDVIEKFNPVTLQYFLDFHGLLYQCGLSFLLADKYEWWFNQLLANELDGFNYYSWSGFDSKKSLDTLNLIAHLIGIPDKYYWKDWELWKFDTIESAKKSFQTIHETGTIKDQKIVKPGNFLWNWASEVKLMRLGVLWRNGDFKTQRAEELLEDWHEDDTKKTQSKIEEWKSKNQLTENNDETQVSMAEWEIRDKTSNVVLLTKRKKKGTPDVQDILSKAA